jgi:biopolymer transport protein ExbD
MQNSPRPVPRADINVTPLGDVCLVLLIIFLVVTPLLNHRDSVKLPEGSAPSSIEEPEQKIFLSVSWPDRTTWFGESWLPEPEMLAKLKELHARSVGQRLVVVADRRLAYADVRGILRTAREAGFGGVELAATKERPSD